MPSYIVLLLLVKGSVVAQKVSLLFIYSHIGVWCILSWVSSQDYFSMKVTGCQCLRLRVMCVIFIGSGVVYLRYYLVLQAACCSLRLFCNKFRVVAGVAPPPPSPAFLHA